MADVLHRTTKQYLRSVNTPDYPTADWIHDPDLSAVAGFPSKYWTITGDTVSLMSQAERDALDAAEATASKDAEANEYDAPHPNALRASLEIIIDEFNRQSVVTNAILDAINTANNLADVKAATALITPRPTRDLSNFKTALRIKLDG